MRLVELIKALIDTLDETGDCEVFITTQNENQLYETALLHFIEPNKLLNKPFLRIEGIKDDE